MKATDRAPGIIQRIPIEAHFQRPGAPGSGRFGYMGPPYVAAAVAVSREAPESTADHAPNRMSPAVGFPSTNSYHGSVTTIGLAGLTFVRFLNDDRDHFVAPTAVPDLALVVGQPGLVGAARRPSTTAERRRPRATPAAWGGR